MRVIRIFSLFAAFVIFVPLIACTPTGFSIISKDKTYQGHPQKILVINTFPNPANRRIFEDELVKELKNRRINAVVSYIIMPNPVVSNKKAIAAQAKEVGADTVLINRPLGKREDKTLDPESEYQDLFIKTQTEIYDMKSNRLVFSASAETWIRQGMPYTEFIRSYVKDLVDHLLQQGLF